MSTNGEQTRNESYQSEQPVVAGKRAVVLEFVQARGSRGATREEIAGGAGLSLSSVCGRVNELEEAGLLQTTSMRRIGKSGKGNSVVCAVEHASGDTSITWRESSIRQAIPGDCPGDSGRATGNEGQGDCGEVRGQAGNGPKHPVTTQLAALKAKPTDQQLNLF
jgi:predicted transcriptional regulator